ncbi:hypothetical protein SPOA0192 (plasmid) [Ruegeria pomeroyi DSS-3]|uniref:Protozoan/cyanobacterial globin family protein n=2 Tax=Ruegeria pomeroyi TaxID=89184 RepID=Q5LL37_RUEPO|nr:group III truncated hemoglobin [Ruegeria pomeroyi]AAV97326.1 hypothetical protein SPOA0192 [Ruegeria pomeroyi DSS-3]NVK96797.1 group III truncated hemoglobin [Ruegeria pomeroyi]NVL00015.1 group III truncated hemoglobin [Ruegeria pomeroyi]HCE71353.1 globin family protein [Ruegeria sp.]
MSGSSLRPHQLFDITRTEIDQVVRRFYAEVRAHDVLGPVFNSAVTDWPEHEDKISGFWAGAILREPGYFGNPMQVHIANPNIRSEHFPVWLDLFQKVLEQELTGDVASAFSLLAQRIGKGLSMGIENFRQPDGAAPNLT